MDALLFQLPLEVLLEVIKLIHEEYRLAWIDSILERPAFILLFPEQVEKWSGHPLKALRLYGSFSPYGSSI